MIIPSMVSDIKNDIISIDGDATVSEAAEKMLVNKIGSILVDDDGHHVGIVTKSDLLSRIIVPCIDPRVTSIRKIMSTPLITIHMETPILEAIRFMRHNQVSRLVVVDMGEPVGIVSETDLIKAVQYASLSSFRTLMKPR